MLKTYGLFVNSGKPREKSENMSPDLVTGAVQAVHRQIGCEYAANIERLFHGKLPHTDYNLY